MLEFSRLPSPRALIVARIKKPRILLGRRLETAGQPVSWRREPGMAEDQML